MVAPRPRDVATPPGDPRETAAAYAAVKALREAVDAADAGCRKDAAAAAWHAEPLLRFLSAALGGRVAGVRVNENGFIVVTAELSAVAVVEVSIAVGPEGSFACTVSAGDTHLACTAPDLRSFERALNERLAEVGVPGSGTATVNAGRHGVIPAPTTRQAPYPGAETGCGVQPSTVPGCAGVSQVAYGRTVWDGSGPTSNGSARRGWNRGRTRRGLAETPMNPGFFPVFVLSLPMAA